MGMIQKVYSAELFCRYSESAYVKEHSGNLEIVTPCHLSLFSSQAGGLDREPLKAPVIPGADKQTFYQIQCHRCQQIPWEHVREEEKKG